MVSVSMIQPKPGVYKNFDEKVYHGWDLCSATYMKALAKSPAHLYAKLGSKEQVGDWAIIGRAYHTLALEGVKRFEERFIAGDGRTAGIKAKVKQDPLKDRLTTKQLDQVIKMADSIKHDKLAHSFIHSPGDTELSIVWDDEHGIRCKARIDKLCKWNDYPCVVDIKGTQDASPDGFAASIIKYGYDIQAAHYLDAMDSESRGKRCFIFVAVEKFYPYAIGCYQLDEFSMRAAKGKLTNLKQQYVQCKKSGKWPGYTPDEVGVISL